MSSPAQSPREPDEPDQEAPTPSGNDNQNADDSEMNRGDDPNAGYDFEIKEQDRWLPIANGKSSLASPILAFDWLPPSRSPCPCHSPVLHLPFLPFLASISASPPHINLPRCIWRFASALSTNQSKHRTTITSRLCSSRGCFDE
ncbi:hypothetical protein BDY17DRAFT_101663 [Neohortaea acidophila]|uniref:Uncharacterized protein n=1 Tax=Neohortaea acidophila TaxID=245834 RepID=A0A6A6PZB9_9PEZI|nr:uncharacterized protein BDY17DRAFT_101663 [Neohortaea acidophila]KAF2485365.1 hypothetical protein BDY17DRAFT_101663 [Neohortaea acidophila]